MWESQAHKSIMSTVEQSLNGMELEELPQDLINLIAGHLMTHDVARMKAVCKAWREIGSLLEVQQAAFKHTWNLRALQDEPKTSNFYLAAGLAHFVMKVSLGPKVSLASVLLKFRTDGVTLRVLNNCASDMLLECRPYIYIPVPSKEMLEGRVGVFHYDSTCRRQLVILAEADASGSFLEGSSVPKALMDGLARSDTSYKPPDTKCSASESHELSSNQREALMKKLSKQMSKGLRIDDGTAAYYLRLTDGNMKDAIQLFKDDERWEHGNPVGMLPLRQRSPLPEYAGKA